MSTIAIERQTSPLGSTHSARRSADYPFRILLVDDEPSICALNAKALAKSGYRVDSAEDGSVAWLILQLQSYDLMITDNNMPNLSGIGLIKNLRGASMALPIIMATGMAPHDEFDRDPCLKPDAILNKPYSVGELLETVAIVLQASACCRGPISPPQVQPDL